MIRRATSIRACSTIPGAIRGAFEARPAGKSGKLRCAPRQKSCLRSFRKTRCHDNVVLAAMERNVNPAPCLVVFQLWRVPRNVKQWAAKPLAGAVRLNDPERRRCLPLTPRLSANRMLSANGLGGSQSGKVSIVPQRSLVKKERSAPRPPRKTRTSERNGSPETRPAWLSP